MIRSRLVLRLMTGITIGSQIIKPQFAARRMATVTVGRGMRSNQIKTLLLVQLLHLLHHPSLAGMATLTVISNRLLMHIGMTRRTTALGLHKIHIKMAFPAIHSFMLSGEHKTRSTVIKRTVWYYFPSVCRMADGTVHLEPFAVRRFCGDPKHQSKTKQSKYSY